MTDINESHPELIIYQRDDGRGEVAVKLEGDSVWLTQAQLAELYDTTKQNIGQHIKNILADGELFKKATVKKIFTIQSEGKRQVEREIEHYNLDMIISLGYRINSKIATKFRQWATARLTEYIIKGFTMDDERLKNLGGGNYWKELLNRIRDIRSSEKVMYRQVLDLFATAVDYDGKSAPAQMFFKTVQNKLHFAAHGQTAAETIYARVDANKDFAGLMVFKGEQPTMPEALIAKNYLNEKELRELNFLVTRYFDRAEHAAEIEQLMKMADYNELLDNELVGGDKEILSGGGKISHEKAITRAKTEFRKYESRQINTVERDYLELIKTTQKRLKNKEEK
jgi:hypothetical protein